MCDLVNTYQRPREYKSHPMFIVQYSMLINYTCCTSTSARLQKELLKMGKMVMPSKQKYLLSSVNSTNRYTVPTYLDVMSSG